MTVDKRTQRASARKLAKLLEAAPAGKAGEGILTPPAMLLRPDFKAALTVWQEVAPLIDARALLMKDDRLMLAVFCCAYAAWARAQIDVAENGDYFMVPSTKGPARPWDNPMADVAKDALKVVMDLSARFGLTALDRARLHKAQKDDPAAPLFAPVDRKSSGGDAANSEAPTQDGGDSWADVLDAPANGEIN